MSVAPVRRKSAPPSSAAAACLLAAAFVALGPPPADGAGAGEWRVDTVQFLDNASYLSGGSIIVLAGGVLTVRNSTVLMDPALEGGISITVNTGGSLVIEDSEVKSNSSLHYNFLVSGHLEVRRSSISGLRGDSGLGGLEIDGGDARIEDARIHHNRYYGAFLRSGSPVIRNTTFEANVVGVFVLPGATPLLENVTILNSTSFGLKLSDAAPVVRNLTVRGAQGFAIGAIRSTLDIVGCELTGGEVGLDAALGTTGSVEGCSFLSTGTGARVSDSPALTISNSTFVGAGTGVNSTSATIAVQDSHFLNAGVGVVVSGAVPGPYGGEAVRNAFEGPGTAFVLQVPNFFLEGNTYAEAGTSTRVFHTVTLLIEAASGAPVAQARVEVRGQDGELAFSGNTNATGEVTATLEAFREFGNGTRLDLTPHAVRIVSAGLVTETEVNASTDHTERITLAEPGPAAPSWGITREGLLLVGALFGTLAIAGVAAVLRGRRRSEGGERPAGRGRRGPRRGR